MRYLLSGLFLLALFAGRLSADTIIPVGNNGFEVPNLGSGGGAYT